MDKEFLKLHNIKNIYTTSGDVYSPYFTIEYENGEKIIEYTDSKDYDQLINRIKETILNNSLHLIRKKKINKICQKMN
jgi:hypothetical protein